MNHLSCSLQGTVSLLIRINHGSRDRHTHRNGFGHFMCRATDRVESLVTTPGAERTRDEQRITLLSKEGPCPENRSLSRNYLKASMPHSPCRRASPASAPRANPTGTP